MVKRLVDLLHKEINGLHEAAYLLALFAFLSQLLGLVRDRLLAYSYGASVDLDLYYAAFRLPDLIFMSVASLFSVSVLIPFLIERLADRALFERFINNIFSFFLMAMVVTSILGFFAVPFLNRIFFPGITDETLLVHLTLYTRILLLSPILLGLSNLLASITQVSRRFMGYAISPLLYNTGIILGIVFLGHRGILGVILGVIMGALLHLSIQVPSLLRDRVRPHFKLQVEWREIQRIVCLSLPRTIALSTNHVALLFLTAFASLLPVGSIAVFNFAFNLQSVPLSIIGVSYSVAAFPTLSRLFSKGARSQFLDEITIAGRHIIFWSLPIMILFIVLRAQVVRTILGSGQFSWADTRLTAAALALFAVSALSQSLVMLLVRGYYSASETRKPLAINLLSSALIVAAAFFLLHFFSANAFFRDFIEALLRVEGIHGGAVLMIPLGFSIGSIVNMFSLWYLFHHDFMLQSAQLARTFFEALGASLIMGYVTYRFLDVFDDFFNLDTLHGVFFQGLLSGLIGIATGILILYLLRSEELCDVWRTLHHKIWKSDVLLPGQSDLQ